MSCDVSECCFLDAYSLHRRTDYQKSFVYLIRQMNEFDFVVFFSQDLRVKLEHEREKRWVGTFSLFLQLSVLSLISFLSSYPSSRYAISKISHHREERKICQAAQKNRNVPLKVFWHLDAALCTHTLWYSLADGERGKKGLSQVFELNGTPNINFQCPVGHPYSHTQNMSFFPSQDQMPTRLCKVNPYVLANLHS